MDWKLFGTAFITIFLAELGDKTQLAAFALAGNEKRPFLIFSAAALALILSTAIGVAAGSVLSKFVSPLALNRIAGTLFILIGVWTLYKS